MTRIVLIYLLPLCFVLAVLSGAMLIVGRRQPESPLIERFHLRDCAPPCWIGIVPGQTRISDAIPHFAEVFDLPDSAIPNFPLDASAAYGFGVSVSGQDDETILVYLEFTFGISDSVFIVQRGLISADNFMPSLGDIVAFYGLPRCVDPHPPSFFSWSLFYYVPGGMMQIEVEGGDSVRWTHPISFLYMTNRSLAFVSEDCAAVYPWRGFDTSRYPQRVIQ